MLSFRNELQGKIISAERCEKNIHNKYSNQSLVYEEIFVVSSLNCTRSKLKISALLSSLTPAKSYFLKRCKQFWVWLGSQEISVEYCVDSKLEQERDKIFILNLQGHLLLETLIYTSRIITKWNLTWFNYVKGD